MIVAVLATAATADAALKRITASGVGKLQLGMTYRDARAKHLIGPIHHGCELGGPNTRAAALARPLRGSVDFTLSSPRKVANIVVTAGAAARGVGIGATLSDVKAAFPGAKVDHRTDRTFELSEVRVPKGAGGPLVFAISTRTHTVFQIGIPGLSFCE